MIDVQFQPVWAMQLRHTGGTKSIRAWRLWAHLAVFGFILCAPVILLSGYLAHWFAETQREERSSRARYIAQGTLVALDREFAGIIATLHTLATSSALETGDLAGFHFRAKMAMRDPRSNIIIRDATGQQMLNTRVAMGQPLPMSALPEAERTLSLYDKTRDDKPRVSNLFIGALKGKPVFVVSIPIKIRGEACCVLSLSVDPQSVSDMLSRQPPPAGWTVVVTDRDHVIVATTREPETYFGKLTSEASRRASIGENGVHVSVNLIGNKILRAYHRSPLSGWMVAAWIPLDEIDGPLRRSLLYLIAAGVLLLSTAFGLAFFFARWIAVPIHGLAARSARIMEGQLALPERSRVREVNEVAASLNQASITLHESTAALRESEQRLRLALEAGRMGVWNWDLISDIVYWDVTLRKLFGLDPKSESVQASFFFQRVHPGDRDQLTQRIEKCKATGALFTAEFRFNRDDGAPLWIAARGHVEFDAAKHPVRMIGINFDITERRSIETKVQESEARLRLALEAGHMGAWDWDLTNNDVHWDASQYAIYGVDPNQPPITPRQFFQHVHPDDRASLDRIVKHSWKTGETVAYEFRLLRPDGAYRWIGARGQAQLGKDGRPVRMSGIDVDITERKEAEQALARSRHELEVIVAERTSALRDEMRRREAAQEALAQATKREAIGRITSSVAHDFNNSLQVIQNGLDMYLRDGMRTVDRVLLEDALRITKAAASITRKLVNFGSNQVLRATMLDLNTFASEMQGTLDRFLDGAAAISTQLAPQLWPVRVDRDELVSAILNLAANARDAMPNGGRITLATYNVARDEAATAKHLDAKHGDFVLLSVSDTGNGMPPETQNRAFEPFFTTKRHGLGAGLGLSAIDGFIRQSGGHVVLESQLGVGTTISLYLPRAIPLPDAQDGLPKHAQPVQSPPLSSAATPRAQRESAPRQQFETPSAGTAKPAATILVVDDDAAVRRLSVRNLIALGYTVIEASDAAGALETIKSGRTIDLLFTDIVMPKGISGHDLVTQAKGLRPELRSLLTTGFSEELTAGVPGQCPHPAILPKPFNCEQLACAINVALSTPADNGRNATAS